jgi:hypothetical protein
VIMQNSFNNVQVSEERAYVDCNLVSDTRN